jgi:hypothetical protein
VRVVGIWPNLRRCIPPAEPRWCLIRARTIQTGKCRERPEETSVLLLSEPPVIALSHAGPWARFFLRQNRMAGARPARSYYLKTIEGTSQSLWLPHTRESQIFLRLGGTAPPLVRFRLAGRAAPPSPIPSRPVPLEPRCNFAGALRFQRPSQPLPLLPRSPLLTLTLLRQPVLTYAVAPAHGPQPLPKRWSCRHFVTTAHVQAAFAG